MANVPIATIATESDEFLADVSETQALLGGGAQGTVPSAPFQHVLDQLLPWLEARARRATTVQLLSEGLGLATDVGELLLVEFMQGIGATPLVETFEAGGNLDGKACPCPRPPPASCACTRPARWSSATASTPPTSSACLHRA